MTPDIIFGIAVVGVAVLAMVAKWLPKRRPPSAAFQCSRCGASARHDDRTAEAWRSGKKKFFCQACHAKWLQSRSAPERGSGSSRAPGCLGAFALIALLPLGGLFTWAAFAW